MTRQTGDDVTRIAKPGQCGGSRRLPCLMLAALIGAGLAASDTRSVRATDLASVRAELAADTVITLRTLGSTLEFTPARISAKHGTRVTIRYVNEGTIPHNWVLLYDEDDLDLVGPAAYDAAATGYIPMAEKDKLVAWTDLASPGQTVEVTFTVPPPGEYTFACLFPGHYNMMLGTLRSLN